MEAEKRWNGTMIITDGQEEQNPVYIAKELKLENM